MSDFNEAYKNLCVEVSSCRTQAKAAGDAIKDVFSRLRKEIDAREATLLGKVEKESTRYNAEAKLLADIKDISDSAPVDKARASLDSWGKVDLVTSAKAALSAESSLRKVKELKKLSNDHKEETCLAFRQGDSLGAIAASISSFGDFVVSKAARRPNDLRVLHVGAYTVLLTWSKSTKFSKYSVLKKKRSEKEFDKDPAWEGTKNSCIIYQLSSNTEYEFCIKGFCGDAWSVESDVVRASTVELSIKELSELSKKVDNRPVCLKAFRYIVGYTNGKAKQNKINCICACNLQGSNCLR